jgi:alkanesulfonate monooxygenase SsuD/methylene tetrahydromethanopterin reductase-like flavin-dependent oxidoreductase (luciferase family)
LSAAAVQTTRIGLGVAIMQSYLRHPLALASQALTVASLAPGRFRLGVGPGGKGFVENMLGLDFSRPLAHLREYVTVLRTYLAEGKVNFDGQFFHVHAQMMAGVQPPKVSVPISALRAASYRLAGEVADGAISWLSPIPYLVKMALPAMQEGAQAASRPTPPLLAHVLVAMSTDRAAIRAATRAQFGFYARIPHYAQAWADAGYSLGSDGALPDALIDAIVVSGTATEIEARLREILDMGMGELLVSPVTVVNGPSEAADLASVLSA